MHRGQSAIFRPSRVLGLLVCVELIIFATFIFWQITLSPTDPRKFNLSQWVLPGAAMTAMLGWGVSALVTISNSVKQHSINTLLQSRLSATYMCYADLVNTTFNSFAKTYGYDATKWDGTDPVAEMDREALRYVLNYMEFIAIGVRHGDLNRTMMRSSLGSILKNTVIFSRSYIESSLVNQPRAFCNLLWLFNEWKTPTKRERFEEWWLRGKNQ